jgi:hypothetical protein
MSTPNTEGQSLIRPVSFYNIDGLLMGDAAADYIGFYGVSPIVQPSGVSQAVLASFTSASGISALYTIVPGSSTSAFFTIMQVSTLMNQVMGIRTALVNLGLIKGSA